MRERPRGFGEAVCVSEQRPQGWLGRQWVHASGGALTCSDQSRWWRRHAMVEGRSWWWRHHAVAGADCGGQHSCMWVGGSPMSVSDWSHRSRCREERCNNIFFKSVVAAGWLMSVGPLLLCCTVATGQAHVSLLCNHYSDWIVVTSHLPVAKVCYNSLLQRCIVVVMHAGWIDIYIASEEWSY
jgi:hypothetical protein